MDDTYLSAKEVSVLLGVSVQTIRNWDDSGHLKASRTIGGHRRYVEKDVNEFLRKKKGVVAYSSWEAIHDINCYKLRLEEAKNDPRARACGGFTKEDISILLKNQDKVIDQKTKEEFDEDFFFEIASEFCIPYLFDTYPIVSPNDLIYYKRYRKKEQESFMVIESEEICAKTRKIEIDRWVYDEDQKKTAFYNLVKETDQECINDIMFNCKFAFDSTFEKIEDKIKLAIEKIEVDTNSEDQRIVIFPPELIQNKKMIRLNNNLKTLPIEDDSIYQTFISRLVPEDKILIMTKSNKRISDFLTLSYIFCPYLLFCIDDDKNSAMMRYAKKLTREGSKYFACINVKG